MPTEGHPSLPEWIRNSYISLERYLCEQSDQDSFTRQKAIELIAKANPEFNDADINHALDHLLNRGWLYEVNGRLIITELQCVESNE